MSSTRTPISNSQRLALRHHFHSTNPRPSQAALAAWFKTEFGHEIGQSIISRTLSDSYAHLENGIQAVSAYRSRNCQWPWLEMLLTEWLQELESSGSKAPNDVIGRKARQLWENSEMSKDHSIPVFSGGWVVKFRQRHAARLQSLSDGQCARKITKHASNVKPGSRSRVAAHTQVFVPQSTPKVWCTGDPPTSNFQMPTTFSFSADLLLRLVQHNTYRALMSNKSIIKRTTVKIDATDSTMLIKQFPTRLCGGMKVVRPLFGRNMPESLYPTEMQMTCAHSDWLTMLPCPRLRDNLISRGEDFVPERMCEDLFGELFQLKIDWAPPIQEEEDDTEMIEDKDGYAAERKSMLIWGEPWRIESWEVTPTFLKRWRWALEGCDELINASNRWRALRHEDPILWP